MCIIIYKPAGVALPSNKRMRACFVANPDGAGMMYVADGRVHIRKGYMTFGALRDAITPIRDIARDVPMVFHFRIGTQGYNDAANTHPFPITSDAARLTARKSTSDVALAHNGIISLTSSYSYHSTSDKHEPYSDTFYYVRDFASLVIRSMTYYRDKRNVLLLDRMADSKLAILSADGHCELVGAFYADGGCYYSNMSYIPTKAKAQTTYSAMVDGWEDDDDIPPAVLAVHSVAGCYIDPSAWLIHDATDKMISAGDSLFVIDANRDVYEYVDELNAIVPMLEWRAVQDNAEAVRFDSALAVHFRLYDDLS